MALYSAFTSPAASRTTYGDPQGESTQNALLRSLSQNVVTPTTAAANTGFGSFNQSGDATPAGQVTNAVGLNQAQNTANLAGENTPTGATAGGGGGGGGGGNLLDFSGDPILAQIRALNAMNVSNAQAAALAQTKRAEIGYGYDPALQYADAETQAAAQQNPFSTLAQLLQAHNQRTDVLTENMNKSNLFYSGERIKQTGLEGRGTLQAQANAQGSYQNQIDQIIQGVLNAKMAAQQSELGGESAAYDRAIQFALANGTGYPGGGGAGGAGGGGGGVNPDFFQQGHVPGYDDNAIYNAAVANAPAGMTAHSVVHNGVPDNGGFWVKYDDPHGGTDTIWVPLPTAPAPAATTTAAAPPPAAPAPAVVYPPVTTALLPRPRLVPQ